MRFGGVNVGVNVWYRLMGVDGSQKWDGLAG